MRRAIYIIRRKLHEVRQSPPSKWREACITTLKELEDEFLEVLWDEEGGEL